MKKVDFLSDFAGTDFPDPRMGSMLHAQKLNLLTVLGEKGPEATSVNVFALGPE